MGDRCRPVCVECVFVLYGSVSIGSITVVSDRDTGKVCMGNAKLTCEKHHRILIGKDRCVDCESEDWEVEWRERYFDRADEQLFEAQTNFVRGLIRTVRAIQHTFSFNEGYCSRGDDLPKSYEKGKEDGIHELCDYLLRHGHGGGNWRRIVMMIDGREEGYENRTNQ